MRPQQLQPQLPLGGDEKELGMLAGDSTLAGNTGRRRTGTLEVWDSGR